MIYRIRNWGDHFENNRTRELKELRFVILPNKHDGDGYTELLDHPNGAAHYGAWCAIVQVASKGKHPAEGCDIPAGCCECRGVLLREGDRAHDPDSLSRLTRIPSLVFAEVLPRLVSIGWMSVNEPQPPMSELDSESPQGDAVSRSSPVRRGMRKRDTEQNRTEQNRTEGKGTCSKAALVRSVFDFWKEHLDHPKAVLDGKRETVIAARLSAGYTVNDLMAAVRGCKNTPFNMGDNPENRVHDDIELICRDSKHVENFMARANEAGFISQRTPTIAERMGITQ
jgi:hypothetical protein